MEKHSLTIDYTQRKTELCEIGGRHQTDKSVYNTDPTLHKHPYTPIYYDILEPYVNSEIRIAEIGIGRNASTRMWRELLKNAQIDLYEFYQAKIDLAIQDDLSMAKYIRTDVSKPGFVSYVFSERYKETNEKYMLIIDDSTHNINDQIRIIYEALDYLESGGKMVIEDIFRKEAEDKYWVALELISSQIKEATFLITNHKLEHSPQWDNSKLLILTKK